MKGIDIVAKETMVGTGDESEMIISQVLDVIIIGIEGMIEQVEETGMTEIDETVSDVMIRTVIQDVLHDPEVKAAQDTPISTNKGMMPTQRRRRASTSSFILFLTYLTHDS